MLIMRVDVQGYIHRISYEGQTPSDRGIYVHVSVICGAQSSDLFALALSIVLLWYFVLILDRIGQIGSSFKVLSQGNNLNISRSQNFYIFSVSHPTSVHQSKKFLSSPNPHPKDCYIKKKEPHFWFCCLLNGGGEESPYYILCDLYLMFYV